MNTIKGKDVLSDNLIADKEYRLFIYDFKRPDKFSKDQIRTLSILHETFARLSTTSLSAQLRILAQMHVTMVDQMTYEEFIKSIPNPSTLAVINMDPLKGSAVLEIDPFLSFSILDRLFGGQGDKTDYARDLTDIEASVMEGMILRVLGNLKEAWSTVIGLRPRLGQIETNPQFAQIVPPAEMVVVVTFETKINDVTGTMNFCFPYLTLEPIIPKLSAKYWYSLARKNKTNVDLNLGGLKVDSEIHICAEDLSIKQIGNISKNMLLKLPEYKENTAYLNAGNKNIIKLKKSEIKDQLYFTVIDEDKISEKDLEIIKQERAEKSSLDSLEEILKTSLGSLADKINNNMEKLNSRIDEINERQDELTDQIVFNSGGGDIPAELPAIEKDMQPFSFIGAIEIESLFNFIQAEHPQLIALILSYLEPGFAAAVLSKFENNLQTDIIKRISCMDRTAPEVLKAIERVLEIKLNMIENYKKVYKTGGINSATKILNVSSSKVEINVIQSLEKDNPELAEELKKQMFVFEDIVCLDDKVIKLILSRADNKIDLLLSLKATNEAVRNKIISLIPDKESFRKKLENMGPARLSDIEAAQQKIINIIRMLEDEGAIVIARAGEDELVE